MIHKSAQSSEKTYRKITALHHVDNHPLNIEFTERVLSKMDIAIRDRSWSEWVRSQKDGFISVLKDFSKNATDSSEHAMSVSYFKWCLTLTDLEIRGVASKSLFIAGHENPSGIFSETIKSLSLNDDYISMRLVPICFGIVTNIKIDSNKENIVDFYKGLCSSLVESNAISPTNNIIIRQYFLKIREFLIEQGLVDKSDANTKFAPKIEPKSLSNGDPLEKDLSRALGMDFENYTLGTLFKDRRNYDDSHQGHQDCVSYILGLLAFFNWNSTEMMELDKRLSNYSERSRRNPVERYGKKYSWIGYYRYAGILEQSGSLNVYYDYFKNGDVDPSFIRLPEKDPLPFSLVNFKSHPDDKDWFTKSKVTFPKEVYKRAKIVNVKAPWILIYGYYSEKDTITDRRIYGVTQSILVKKSDVEKIKKCFEEKDPYAVLRHEPPRAHDILANEIPWSKAAQGAFHEYEDSEPKEVAGANAEYLVYDYSHEKDEEWLNTASSYHFPTYRLINKLKFTRIPRTLAFRGQDGKVASINLKQGDDDGRSHLFYMNLNELKNYAKGKVLMTFCWGEKELDVSHYHQKDSWLVQLQRNGRNFWKKVFVQSL